MLCTCTRSITLCLHGVDRLSFHKRSNLSAITQAAVSSASFRDDVRICASLNNSIWYTPRAYTSRTVEIKIPGFFFVGLFGAMSISRVCVLAKETIALKLGHFTHIKTGRSGPILSTQSPKVRAFYLPLSRPLSLPVGPRRAAVMSVALEVLSRHKLGDASYGSLFGRGRLSSSLL